MKGPVSFAVFWCAFALTVSFLVSYLIITLQGISDGPSTVLSRLLWVSTLSCVGALGYDRFKG